MLVLLLVGGLAATALSLRAARGALDRYRWPYVSLAVMLVVGLGWLSLLAVEDDPYYEPDDVSRWGHAAKSGQSPVVVVAAFVIALAAIVALLLGARSPSRARLRRLVMPATALACAALVLAALALSIGH